MIVAAALLLQAAAPPPVPAVETPSREFTGIWLDEFEGQQFFEGASSPADIRPFGSAPWIDIDRAAVLNAMLPRTQAHDRIVALYVPRLYRIRFVGHVDPPRDCRSGRTLGGIAFPPQPPGCIGVGGSFPARIEASKVLELVDLGPLPRKGQPAG